MTPARAVIATACVRQHRMSALVLWLLFTIFWTEVHGSDYVKYLEGTGLPIILTCPHGGTLSPAPERPLAGCWDGEKCIWKHGCGIQDKINCKSTRSNDLYTQDMTMMLRDELCAVAGRCPSAIIGNINRRVLDFNREIGEACFGVETMEAAYKEYYGYLQDAKDSLNGTGIIFDIHGHGHKIPRAELGYTITKARLNSGDYSMNMTSIRSLLERSPYDMSEILSGEYSMGRYLLLEGYDAIPSPVYLIPEDTSYFSGGYTTKVYGSRYEGSIDAIQIESARAHRDMPERLHYVEALASSMMKFYNQHYTLQDEMTSAVPETTTAKTMTTTTAPETTTFMTTEATTETQTTTIETTTTTAFIKTTAKSENEKINGSPNQFPIMTMVIVLIILVMV